MPERRSSIRLWLLSGLTGSLLLAVAVWWLLPGNPTTPEPVAPPPKTATADVDVAPAPVPRAKPVEALRWTHDELTDNPSWTGDLPGMVKRRVVRLLLVPNRTDYYLDQGEPKGLTAAYASELGRRLNAQYKTGPRPIQVAFVPVTRDRLLPSLLEGKGDIAVANLTITPERQKLVDFSPPFLTDVREIVVTGPGAPPLASLEDLSGMEVPARRSSSYWPSLEALSGRLRQEHMAGITLEPLPEVVEDEDLLELVNAGMLPLIVVDEHKARAWAEALPSIGLRDDLVLRSGGQIAWAYRKRSPKLADYLASFAKATARGTEFGNIVGDRYLVDAEQLRHNGPDDQRRFLQLLAQFRRFGDRYRFDPLLLAAQGFQESGLDQSKRNPGGAVGIMQLRPETARDPSVGIRASTGSRTISRPAPSICAT